MKTHIQMALLAFFMTACASRTNSSQAKSSGNEVQEQYSYYNNGARDRVR